MKITYKNGYWYYPNGKKFTRNETPSTPLWCSEDRIIRLMDCSSKSDAHEQIEAVKNVFKN